jgi:tetratricopeptide (TPR) repeat protein
MAECYVSLLKYDEGRSVLKDATPSAQKAFLEAKCDYATKKVAEAKKTLDKLLETTPDHLPSLLLRSEIAHLDEDLTAEKGFLERAVEAAPYDGNAHLKLANVLLRLDEKDAAKREGDRAKELLDLTVQFSELNDDAAHKPRDILIRRELAALARRLGREEEAKRWERAAAGLAENSKPVAKTPPLSVRAPDSENLLLTPELKRGAPTAAPGPTPPGKVTVPVESGPKACGDEPAEREKKPRDEKPAEKKDEKQAEVFSGPQKGEKLPGFTLKVAGEEEKELDLVKEAGGKPTLLIFVHQVTRPSVGLTRVLGDYAATRKKDGLHAGAIFLTADATETKAWIKRASGALPKSVPLGIADGGQEGPGAYGLNRNVAMTILVAKDGKVTANFALVQPSLQADGPKILKEIVDVLGGGKVPSIEELLPQPGAPRRERGKEPERPKAKEGAPKEGEPERKRDGEKKGS